jgi:hypothetical protein
MPSSCTTVVVTAPPLPQELVDPFGVCMSGCVDHDRILLIITIPSISLRAVGEPRYCFPITYIRVGSEYSDIFPDWLQALVLSGTITFNERHGSWMVEQRAGPLNRITVIPFKSRNPELSRRSIDPNAHRANQCVDPDSAHTNEDGAGAPQSACRGPNKLLTRACVIFLSEVIGWDTKPHLEFVRAVRTRRARPPYGRQPSGDSGRGGWLQRSALGLGTNRRSNVPSAGIVVDY